MHTFLLDLLYYTIHEYRMYDHMAQFSLCIFVQYVPPFPCVPLSCKTWMRKTAETFFLEWLFSFQRPSWSECDVGFDPAPTSSYGTQGFFQDRIYGSAPSKTGVYLQLNIKQVELRHLAQVYLLVMGRSNLVSKLPAGDSSTLRLSYGSTSKQLNDLVDASMQSWTCFGSALVF